MASKKKHESNYVTVEERFGKGAKVPGHRGGPPVESAGLFSNKVQKKLTPTEERQAVGEHMRYVKTEMERKAANQSHSTDDRPMMFGRDKPKPPQ